jgi:hypothetical protein
MKYRSSLASKVVIPIEIHPGSTSEVFFSALLKLFRTKSVMPFNGVITLHSLAAAGPAVSVQRKRMCILLSPRDEATA